MDAPLISVIIPAYNAERSVGAALASALCQSHPNVEAVVVDDGSSDSTASIVAGVAASDERVRLIRQSNEGVSGARNRGIAAATGEWLALLDADDTFAPARLERLLALARARSADLLADNLRVTEVKPGAPQRNFLAFPNDRMQLEGPIDPVTFVRSDRPRWGIQSAGFIKPLMRRAFVEQHRIAYPVRYSAGEDFYFYLTCLLEGAKLFFVPDALYEYNLQPVSLSHGDDERVIGDYVAASRELRQAAEAAGLGALAGELYSREKDMIGSRAFERVAQEIAAGRYIGAARAILSLPNPGDGVVRVLKMLRYRVAVALGITLRPKLRAARDR